MIETAPEVGEIAGRFGRNDKMGSRQLVVTLHLNAFSTDGLTCGSQPTADHLQFLSLTRVNGLEWPAVIA